jgi:hypothetical protein
MKRDKRMQVWCFGMAVVLVLCPLPGRAGAQSGASNQPNRPAISAPFLGLVADAAGTGLHAILGTTGAALFSDVLGMPPVSRLYLPPGQRYALVERAGEAGLAVLMFRGPVPSSMQPVPGMMPSPAMVAFSPQGNSAAVYSREEDRVQVLTGLPDSPHIAQQIQPLNLPESLGLLAISDDASTLLAGSREGSVYLVSTSNAPRLLESARDLAALTFFPGRNEAVICDRGTRSLITLRGGNGAFSPHTIPLHVTELGDGLSVATTIDSREILLADPAGKQVFVISEEGSVQVIHVPLLSSSVQRLSNPNMFVLSAVGVFTAARL